MSLNNPVVGCPTVPRASKIIQNKYFFLPRDRARFSTYECETINSKIAITAETRFEFFFHYM